MKKLFYAAASVCLLAGAIGCSDDYDDSALWNKMNGIDGDIENIKQDLEKLKQDVAGLNETYRGITAMLNGGIITNVVELKDGNKVLGYTITVTTYDSTTGQPHSTDYTIMNGTNGQDGENGAAGAPGADGATPQLGVAKDEATGRYYWTLNGEELTDDQGNKIWATGENGADGEDGAAGTPGTNGKDGKTPELKIDVDTDPNAAEGAMAWYIRYGSTEEWQRLGVFSGSVQGSNIQISVVDGVVTIKQDGKEDINIPIAEANNIKITFEGVDAATGAHMKLGEAFEAVYTIEGATESAIVKAELLNGTDFTIENVPAENKIKITAGETSASDVVLVHVYDGNICAHTSFPIASDIAAVAIAENALTLPISYTIESAFVYSGRVKLNMPAAEDITIAVTPGEITLPEGSYEIAPATIAKGAKEGAYTVTITRTALTAGQTYDMALTLATDSEKAYFEGETAVNIHVTGEASKINLTADMLESQYTGENSVAELCNGSTADFWGSNYWTSCPAADPTYGVYIDIKLPIALRSAKFRYCTRANNNATPCEIKVGVSNDQSAWTLLFSVAENLPTDATAWWEGDTMHDAAEPFSYIRFGVTKSCAYGGDARDLIANPATSTALAELEVYGLY